MSMKPLALVGVLVGLAALTAPMRATTEESSGGVTFNKDVLPILQKNCQSCHRPGEIAPMSFLTYKDTRPWARAMKTAVVSRQMPPWFADPAYGHFANDKRLSDARHQHHRRLGRRRRAGRRREGQAGAGGVPRRVEPEAGHDHRDAEGRAAAGDRHHQLQEHPRQGEFHRRHVGRRGGSASGQRRRRFTTCGRLSGRRGRTG